MVPFFSEMPTGLAAQSRIPALSIPGFRRIDAIRENETAKKNGKLTLVPLRDLLKDNAQNSQEKRQRPEGGEPRRQPSLSLPSSKALDV